MVQLDLFLEMTRKSRFEVYEFGILVIWGLIKFLVDRYFSRQIRIFCLLTRHCYILLILSMNKNYFFVNYSLAYKVVILVVFVRMNVSDKVIMQNFTYLFVKEFCLYKLQPIPITIFYF